MSASTTITKLPKIAQYLNALGISNPIRERIEVINSYLNRIFHANIEEIFIADFIQEDGTHIYQSMDLYSKNRVFSAIDFKNTIDIRTASIKDCIVIMKLLAKDYDFQNASSKSRLTMSFSLDYSDIRVGQLQATGINCDYLLKIIQKYFNPNLRE